MLSPAAVADNFSLMGWVQAAQCPLIVANAHAHTANLLHATLCSQNVCAVENPNQCAANRQVSMMHLKGCCQFQAAKLLMLPPDGYGMHKWDDGLTYCQACASWKQLQLLLCLR